MRNGASLGDLIRQLKQEAKVALSDLTVLSTQNDPFRIDTPAFHEAGRWFRDHMETCDILERRLHNRGIHYSFVSRGGLLLPPGKPYRNDADTWAFLEDRASKAARWLGYVPFEAITDARNAEPVIRIATKSSPARLIKVAAAGFWLPEADELKPTVELEGFTAQQPFRIVFFGEKTSLQDVLGPLADEYDADLYLPSGEISDTMLATMARPGALDGREMIVLVFADCDPAGYQMAVSIAHKLRALKELLYPSLRFRVIAPALTVDQVRALGLPSTPLKETELRGAGWRERYGIEQTEIDALATLQPDILRSIVREAVAPYYDATLARRVRDAAGVWRREAQARLDDGAEYSHLSELQAQAAADPEAAQEKIDQLEREVFEIDVDLPPISVPEPIVPDSMPAPLVSSSMPLLEHIRVLRERKRYGGDAPQDEQAAA
jgi:hypothetical protein